MKILQIHNFYQQGGGEDKVFNDEYEALKRRGHDVHQITFSNDMIKTDFHKVKTAINLILNKNDLEHLAKKITEIKPSVIHLHNNFPIINNSVFEISSKLKIPVVQTLHNFRYICIGSTLFRENNICENCVGNSGINGVLHKCYKNSFFGSLTASFFQNNFKRQNFLEKGLLNFICLNDFAKQKFVQAGLPKESLFVKPNFINNNDYTS